MEEKPIHMINKDNDRITLLCDNRVDAMNYSVTNYEDNVTCENCRSLLDGDNISYSDLVFGVIDDFFNLLFEMGKEIVE